YLRACGDRQRMGRGRRAAQGRVDRAGGDPVRDHDRGQPDRDGDRATFDETEPRKMTAGVPLDSPSNLASGALARGLDLRARSSWRTTKNALMIAAMAMAVALVAIPLMAVLWSVLEKGAGVAFAAFPDFFTSTIP